MDRLDCEKEIHNDAFATNERKRVKKYYKTTDRSKNFHRDKIYEDVAGKTVLEYGCGPGLWTDDEHPLLNEDFELAETCFDEIKSHFFHLTVIAASFTPVASAKSALAGSLNGLDSVLYKSLPFLKKICLVYRFGIETHTYTFNLTQSTQ